ncbi:hypothetical protein FHW36_102691 [Chitinophaga polysaccharea]|uniref:YcxB-like protein n=1 Tax=Chitinophaga polysaccharea TaxID=1293035 RepID=A0A561PXU8_9BACT|nr:hypothetical protein [Chitinophaga polysaccharea]TWF42929.1 hypothetical protein FHW36_102691 [Chitinophaga polysaccharea]
MVITKRIQTTYNTVLRAKMYFFFRKSIWMYLLGMLMLGYAFPLENVGAISSAFVYFIIFALVILVPVYHFSTRAMVRKAHLDANIEFNEQDIIIRHIDNNNIETKSWDWIKRIDITRKDILLIVDHPTRFLIALEKSKLTAPEIQFFLEKKK